MHIKPVKMKTIYLLLCCCICLSVGYSQSIRELGEIRTPWVCYSAQRDLMYCFLGQEEGGNGRIQIRDAKFGKISATIPLNDLPYQPVLSHNEQYIYFSGGFPRTIQRFDINTQKVSTVLVLSNGIDNVGPVVLIPGQNEKFFFSWSNNDTHGLYYFNGEKIVAQLVSERSIALFQNDSTFYTINNVQGDLQQYHLRNEKIERGKVILQNVLANNVPFFAQNDTIYAASGSVWELKNDSLKVLKVGKPGFGNRYHLGYHPASAYYYIYVDGFDRDTVYKYPKGKWQSIDSWTIGADLMGGTFLFAVRLLAEDDFYVTRTPGLLVRRCLGKNTTAVIKEGTEAAACLSLSPVLNLHAAASAYEYIWSNGANNSSVTLESAQPIQLKTGDSTGCLSNWSPTCHVSFPGIHAAPEIDYYYTDTKILFCNKEVRIFMAKQSGVEGFEWSNGSRNPLLKVSTPGKYRVRSLIRNGCPGLWSHYLELEQLPDSIPAQPSILTDSGSFDFCHGTVANLLAPPGYTYYIWQGQETQKSVFSTRTPTTLNLRVGNDLRCLSNSSVSVKVNFNPIPDKPQILRLDNTMATNNFGNKHHWYLNGKLILGEEGQFLEISKNGKYSVFTTAKGCVSPVSDTLEVNDLLLQDDPQKRSKLRLRLSPNPVQTELFIYLNDQNTDGRLYRICNLNGEVFQTGYIGQYGKIQIPDLPRGMYILSLLSSQLEPLASKFFKE